MGEESMILCRDRAGQIHVFLNSCRHRGMKVCRHDEGNTVEFLCPYHGWSYATDGTRVGVPFLRDAYGTQLDRGQWGLVEVAQLESYKGAPSRLTGSRAGEHVATVKTVQLGDGAGLAALHPRCRPAG
jgi:phenylpropionate dioxygenase-like ring-hydroxylating dioxygenase large terminal subunit